MTALNAVSAGQRKLREAIGICDKVNARYIRREFVSYPEGKDISPRCQLATGGCKMLVSPNASEVRWIVDETFKRFFSLTEDDLADLIETPMIDDGRCIARSYRVSTFLAMWLVDIGILQFYDEGGRMLRRANLFAEVEPRAAAA